MIKYFSVVLLSVSMVALGACDNQITPTQLQDQEIVCSLKGEAYIFIDGYEKSVHSVRSEESDPLCKALKPVAAPTHAVVG
jgi:hypothetical protein